MTASAVPRPGTPAARHPFPSVCSRHSNPPGSDSRPASFLPRQIGLKREHEPLAWHARLDKLPRDAPLRPVPLNPDLPVHDVDVDEAPVHAADAVPPHQHQQIPVGGAVEHRLAADLPVRVGNPSVLRENALHELTIPFYGIHCWMTSVCGSNTRSRTRWFSRRSFPIGSSKRLANTVSVTARNNSRSGSTRERTSW